MHKVKGYWPKSTVYATQGKKVRVKMFIPKASNGFQSWESWTFRRRRSRCVHWNIFASARPAVPDQQCVRQDQRTVRATSRTPRIFFLEEYQTASTSKPQWIQFPQWISKVLHGLVRQRANCLHSLSFKTVWPKTSCKQIKVESKAKLMIFKRSLEMIIGK